MKAMVLAAGFGERMRPLTETTPKPLLTVGGKALIDHHMGRLVDAGFDEFVINVSWLAEQIEAHFEESSLSIQFSREAQPLETAGGIIQALPLLGDAPFLVVNADVWTDMPVPTARKGQPPVGGAHLVLVDNPEHNPDGDFTLSASGQLSRETGPRLTYSGLGIFTPDFFEGVPQGNRPLLPLLERAASRGLLTGEHYQGRWVDVGTPQRLAALDAELAIH